MSRIEYWSNVADEAEQTDNTKLRSAALLMIRTYRKWGKENEQVSSNR